MRQSVRFFLSDQLIELSHLDSNMTLLDFLREERQRCGTKEGCAEGDCGACTVTIVELSDGQISCKAVNSCIVFVASLDGKQVLTVEDLKSSDGVLHPVQQAMVDLHGSQCGFCTPGFIMSLFALYYSEENPSFESINDALIGNLCRCTGYRPILDAARAAVDTRPAHHWDQAMVNIKERLEQLHDGEDVELIQNAGSYFIPRNLKALLDLKAKYPKSFLLAGGTDLGLYVTKRKMHLQTIIQVTEVPELSDVIIDSDFIRIGAAVTYSEALEKLSTHYPSFCDMLLRLGSRQIRNLGTIGGNLVNASPIGDSPPSLVALGARVVISSQSGDREMPLDEFFLDYRKTALKPEEILKTIIVPRLGQTYFRTYKLSKRFDQDISSVCGAYYLKLDGERVADIRICYGGMAATPRRAYGAEAFLRSKNWHKDTVESAMLELAKDYQPMNDFRGSAEYRSLASQNLLLRFYLESMGEVGPGGVLDYGN